MPSRWLKRLAIVLSAVVVALLVLELALRVVMLYDRSYLDQLLTRPPSPAGAELNLGDIIRPSADDLLVYDLRPSMRGRFMGHALYVNALGMRDVERPRQKAPGTFRIVGLGDSHMFGWGVEHEETFLAVLERKLAGRFPTRRFEVLNLAVPGYNTVQEVETFARRVDELDPDLVILNWIENDMNIPAFLFDRPKFWTLEKSYLRSFLRRRRALRLGRHVMPLDAILVPLDPRTEQFVLPDEEVPDRYRPLVGRDNMVGALRRLGRSAAERNIGVVLLFDWIDYSKRLSGERDSAASEIGSAVADVGRSVGFEIVDPQDRIVDHLKRHHLDSSALWLSAADGHPNALRHALLADELDESLTKRGLVSERR